MIFTALLIRDSAERTAITKIIKDLVSYSSDEEWVYKGFSNAGKLVEYLENSPLIDLMCCEISKGDSRKERASTGTLRTSREGQSGNKVLLEKSISLIESIRRSYKNMQLLLVVDKTVNPMVYMRPSISAQSLLLSPFSPQTAQGVLSEFIQAFLQDRIPDSEDNTSFLVDTREGKTVIPYNQILFFETRGKKICVVTSSEELDFYDTIENISTRLPDYFMRCHRSTIVNKKKIKFITKDSLLLFDDFEVPVSRRYKGDFKDVVI